MKFVGFDFTTIQLPARLNYTPPGWNDSLSFTVSRRDAPTPDQARLLVGSASRLRPLLFEPAATGGLPVLSASTVVDSLMAVPNAGAASPTADATDLPAIWSQRPRVLDYHEMGPVMCAGFMIVTFAYNLVNRGVTTFAHQDSAVGTAINLAKRKVDNVKVTMLHSNSTVRNENLDQAHTEMCLAKQLDAFLTLLEAHAAHARRRAGAYAYVTDFSLANLAVTADIRWDHNAQNVTVACGGCTGAMTAVEQAWAGKLRSIALIASKAA